MADGSDCADNDGSVHPGAAEVCDGKDNDCDGQTDEVGGQTWYRDADGDGYGNPGVFTQACLQPAGHVADNTDCDDGDPDEHPEQTWHRDADNDGWSDGESQVSCERPAAYHLASELTYLEGDCDDTNSAVQTHIYYLDADGDGYGDSEESIQACSLIDGHVEDDTDCDDQDADEHPGQTWYKDEDSDGYSADSLTETTCERPDAYFLRSELAGLGDCDDTDPSIYPDSGMNEKLLSDAILILQILTGVDVEENSVKEAKDSFGKLGLEDVIYILKKLTEPCDI